MYGNLGTFWEFLVPYKRLLFPTLPLKSLASISVPGMSGSQLETSSEMGKWADTAFVIGVNALVRNVIDAHVLAVSTGIPIREAYNYNPSGVGSSVRVTCSPFVFFPMSTSDTAPPPAKRARTKSPLRSMNTNKCEIPKDAEIIEISSDTEQENPVPRAPRPRRKKVKRVRGLRNSNSPSTFLDDKGDAECEHMPAFKREIHEVSAVVQNLDR